MRTLYALNIGQENRIVEDFVLNKLKNREDIAYILPTVEAIEKVKKYYIDKTKGFINLKFYTFDSLKKYAMESVNMDEIFSMYIISRILKENRYYLLNNVTEGLIQKTYNFIKKVKVDSLDLNKLKNSNIKILEELADVTYKYNIFLKENDLRDGFNIKIEKDKLNLKNVIIDGFYTFDKVSIELIKSMGNTDIIINIPYFTGNMKILEDNKKLFKYLGFDIKDYTEKINIEDRIKSYKDKIRVIIEDNKRDEAFTIYQEIKKRALIDNISFCDMGIAYANENSSILSFMKNENFEFNIKSYRVNTSNIVSEFKTILDYILNPDCENIFRRIESNYFSITDNKDDMEYYLRQINFKNINDLKNAVKENIEIDDYNFSIFMELLRELEKRPKERADFKYYCNYFMNYLKSAEKFILDSYDIFKNDEFFIRDMNIISSIRKVIEKLQTYNIIFGEESIDNYISILRTYIDNIVISKRNDYAVNYGSLIEYLFLDYNTVFICGLNEDYPDYTEKNFIFSKNVVNFLRNIGMDWKDEQYVYENEILKIFSIIEHTDVVYISSSSKQNYSVIFDMLYNENSKVAIKKSPTKIEDLFCEVINEANNNIFNNEKISNLNYFNNYSDINRKIYGEDNRFENEYNGYINGKAKKIVDDILDKYYLSPSSIDNYIKSPFLFLFENILEVKSMNREFDDKEYLFIGNCYHKILQLYFNKFKNTLEEEELKKIAFNVFFERLPLNEELSGINRLIFNYHYNRILEFVKMDINSRNGEEPYLFEKNFKINIDGLKITGRIDRIDKSSNGEIIIDYKRSSVPSVSKVHEGKNTQLPIYALARENTIEAKYASIEDAKFISVFGDISRRENLKGKSAMGSQEYSEFLENARSNLLKIYNEMKLGHYPYIKCDYNDLSDLTRGE